MKNLFIDMIWTINRIIQNFKVNRGVKFSTNTITHFATKLGYRIKRGGGLVVMVLLMILIGNKKISTC